MSKPYTNTMNNISFKANLVIDEKLYKKMPVGTPENFTDNLVCKYSEFINHKLMKELTEGDTIELYKAPHRPGFALGIRFTSDKLDEPLEGGVFTNKKIPDVNVGSLIFQTMQFIIIKSGIHQGIVEPTQKAFIRAAQKLLEERNKE